MMKHILKQRILHIKRLYHHFTLFSFSSCSATHLLQHLIRSLVATEIRLIEQIICIQYSHQTYIIKMQPLRYHLCPD